MITRCVFFHLDQTASYVSKTVADDQNDTRDGGVEGGIREEGDART